jgi:hypothetical protein
MAAIDRAMTIFNVAAAKQEEIMAEYTESRYRLHYEKNNTSRRSHYADGTLMSETLLQLLGLEEIMMSV